MPTKPVEIPEPFRCEVEPDRDTVVVRPVGELDLATVPEVERQLAELRQAGFDRITLRLDRLTFIDSTGMRLAMAWRRAAEADGFAFSVVEAQPTVRRAFDLTGLSALVGLDGDGRG